VPRGHAGTEITVWRHLLSGALSVIHDGNLVALAPVDLARNATSCAGAAALGRPCLDSVPPR
jgi:hypothetical protein